MEHLNEYSFDFPALARERANGFVVLQGYHNIRSLGSAWATATKINARGKETAWSQYSAWRSAAAHRLFEAVTRDIFTNIQTSLRARLGGDPLVRHFPDNIRIEEAIPYGIIRDMLEEDSIWIMHYIAYMVLHDLKHIESEHWNENGPLPNRFYRYETPEGLDWLEHDYKTLKQYFRDIKRVEQLSYNYTEPEYGDDVHVLSYTYRNRTPYGMEIDKDRIDLLDVSHRHRFRINSIEWGGGPYYAWVVALRIDAYYGIGDAEHPPEFQYEKNVVHTLRTSHPIKRYLPPFSRNFNIPATDLEEGEAANYRLTTDMNGQIVVPGPRPAREQVAHRLQCINCGEEVR